MWLHIRNIEAIVNIFLEALVTHRKKANNPMGVITPRLKTTAINRPITRVAFPPCKFYFHLWKIALDIV